jgi:hypothetical protein
LHYTFNGAALSTPALLFEQHRNAPLFTSKSAPSAAQVAQVFVVNNNLQALAVQSFGLSAAVQIAPSTFAAAGTPVSGASDDLTSQLLDNGKSGVNQLLDN